MATVRRAGHARPLQIRALDFATGALIPYIACDVNRWRHTTPWLIYYPTGEACHRPYGYATPHPPTGRHGSLALHCSCAIIGASVMEVEVSTRAGYTPPPFIITCRA